MNLLTTEELTKELKVTRQTLGRYKKQGMPSIKINARMVRYELDKVLEWLKEKNEVQN